MSDCKIGYIEIKNSPEKPVGPYRRSGGMIFSANDVFIGSAQKSDNGHLADLIVMALNFHHSAILPGKLHTEHGTAIITDEGGIVCNNVCSPEWAEWLVVAYNNFKEKQGEG